MAHIKTVKVVQTPGVKLLFGGAIKNIYSSTNDAITLVRRRILVPIYWCTVSDFQVVFLTAIMYDEGIFYYVVRIIHQTNMCVT